MRPTYRRPTVEEDMNMPGSFPRFEELAHRLEGVPRPELPLSNKRDDVGKSARSTAIGSGSGAMTPTFSRQSSQPMSNVSSQQSRNTVRFDLPNLTDDEILSTGYETDSMCSQLSTTTQATTVGSDIGVGDKMSTTRVRDPYYLTAAFVPPRQPSSQPSVPAPLMASVQHDRAPVTRAPSPITHQTGPRLARSRSAVETQPRLSRHASERPHQEARSATVSSAQNLALSERSRKDTAEKFQTLDAGIKSIRRDQTMSTRDSHVTSDKSYSTNRYKEAPQKESLTGRDLKDQQLSDLSGRLRDLGEQRKMLDEIRSNFESQKGMLDRVEKERNELKEAKDVLESKVAMLERSVTNLEKGIGSVERDKDKLRRNHQDEKDSLVKQITSLQLANEGLKARVDAKDKELLGLITSQNMLQGESDKRLAQVDLLTASHDALHDALQREQEPLRARIYGLGEEKKDLLHNLDVKNNVIDELQRKIGDLETEKGELQRKVVDVEQVKDDMRKALDLEKNDLVAQHDQMKKQVEDLTIELDGAKFANISLASQILEADKMRSEMKAAMDTAEAETEKAKADMKAVQDEHEKLTTRIKELEETRAADDADGLRARIQDLEARVNDQNSVPAAAETEPEEPKAPEPAPEPEVQVVVVEPDKSAVLSAVKAQLEAVTKGLHDQIEKITNLEAERAALDTAKSELEAKENDFTTQKTEFESSKASLEEKAGQLEALTERNTALTAQLQTTEDQLAEAKAAHATLEAKVAELKNQMLVLQGQLAFVSPAGLVAQAVATPMVPARARSPRSTAGSVAESTKRSRSASLTRKKKALSTISTMSAPAAERLVLLRSPADRGSIAVVRKSDLHAFKTPKSPRSRSRSRSVAPDSD